MARYYAPSTIFVDEVDALMGSRTGEQEHEASRRMKTQLLIELDGLTRSNDHVFLLAASNIPWYGCKIIPHLSNVNKKLALRPDCWYSVIRN